MIICPLNWKDLVTDTFMYIIQIGKTIYSSARTFSAFSFIFLGVCGLHLVKYKLFEDMSDINLNFVLPNKQCAVESITLSEQPPCLL